MSRSGALLAGDRWSKLSLAHFNIFFLSTWPQATTVRFGGR